MSTMYQAFKAAQDAQAAEFMAQHGQELRCEFDDDQNNDNMRGIIVDSSEGFEGEALDLITAICEAECNEGYWNDSVRPDDIYTANGLYNVDTLGHWSTYRAKDSSGKYAREITAAAKSARSDKRVRKLDGDKLVERNTRKAKDRAVFGIETIIAPKVEKAKRVRRTRAQVLAALKAKRTQ
jgi:hypothetical protein